MLRKGGHYKEAGCFEYAVSGVYFVFIHAMQASS
jgi:hypothetical protein